MRPANPLRPGRSPDVRREVERLDGLPVRPASSRASLDARPGDDDPADSGPAPAHPSTELDPGWVLARLRARDDTGRPALADPLAIVAGRPWWPAPLSVDAGEAIGRLWRHAVAVSLAARRLAREEGDPDPGLVARAGLLHRLGLWALAAVAPDRLAEWLALPDTKARRDRERAWLGVDAASLGRTLAGRWGCEPAIVDATWLHADAPGLLDDCGDDPARLDRVRRAHALAERTPWSLAPAPGRDPGPLDPRVRLLMAEVQARCGGPFVDPDASPREERLSRQVAALRIESAALRRDRDGRDGLIAAIGASDPTDRPEVWAERAGLAWCDLPGVVSARVDWIDPASTTEPVAAPASPPRPEGVVLPLGDPARPCATVHLWTETPGRVADWPGLRAWGAWASLVADRARLLRKLDATARALRDRVEADEADRRAAKLDALAEFAAGAGHELNNPLAVILGRAQLLLTREDDPGAVRSLRAIVAQAQRAHRLLRDLMYVARPPEPRPRAVSADEVLRASLRDAQSEAEARGIRLVGDPRPAPPGASAQRAWVDPDALRHLADILVRNALEATPAGGNVSVVSSGDEGTLRWTVRDTGRGLTASEAAHLFDPFYCGRQAGRGLGLGLPRAARMVERAGGDLTYQSVPGAGSSFSLKLPLASPPSPPDRAATA